ncbi:MAG: His/Gly/Thr/Pro-type tRNA ligase C-terminal domain-containing protein, partial [Candidatus Thermoplasmatota archaeon]|nr:His/Gly/Thr/Pro-type tRNA ligase C-terminal domain-containing protein [Candidatus Thermoplasmatota archaeon]
EKKYWKEFKDEQEITLVPRSGPEIKMNIYAALEKQVMSSNAIAYFVHKTFEILTRIGVAPEKLRFRQQHTDELAHYSFDSWDAEAMLDGDWVEIVGIADRNDLRNHQNASGESMSVRIDDREVIPSIIEPSYGIDRMFLSVLMHSFTINEKGFFTINEKGFKVLKLPRDIAPYHAAVFPHLNKDGLDTMAKEFFEQMRRIDPYVTYDQSGSIGKRYARQDEIGTPYCITFDHEGLADKSVTVRDRDTAKQIRISVNDLLSVPILENKKLIEFSRQQAGL